VEIRLEKIEPLPLLGACDGSQVWNRPVLFSPGSLSLVKAGSGRGKTTLLSILFGMRKDYKGDAFFDGIPIRGLGHGDWSRLRTTRLSCVFQDLQLFDDLTAWQNIEIKNRLTAHKNEEEIRRLFGVLGVEDKIDAPADRLSRGQKQRIAILRALCQPFEFLLLDEPFSHLDRDNRVRTAALILEECRKKGAGLILASLEDEPALTGCASMSL
jgi:ABC-type lipoprotein export system ATPase subunit